MEPAVVVERDGHIVTLTLNRPDKKNAFNPEMLCRLADAWDMIDGDDDIRACILTGAGGNFSAGADLDQLVSKLIKGLPPDNEFEARLQKDPAIIYKGFLKDYYLQTPIIAAIEGYCYAGGTEILQALDIRVAGQSARIAISEVKRGLFPMSASTVRLRRQISFTNAMELLLVGDPISAAEARRIGLIGHVVADGQALAKAREIAGRIAANGPLAVRNIKRAVIETESLTENEAFKRETELGMQVMMSEDAREGPRAFLEKRPPVFKGR
jgi:enoyl-CoA hydratase